MSFTSTDIEGSSIQHKRWSDDQQLKIDELIEEEGDRKTRLTLMIMSNLNKSIIANTELIQSMHGEVVALKKEVETQVAEQEAVRNQGMGAYKVMRVLTPTIWIITCTITGLMYNSYTDFHKEILDTTSSIEIKLQKLDTLLTLRGIVEAPIKK